MPTISCLTGARRSEADVDEDVCMLGVSTRLLLLVTLLNVVGCAGVDSNGGQDARAGGDGGIEDSAAGPDADLFDASCPTSGDAEVLACGLGGPTSLALTGGWAYWGTLSGDLERLALSTGRREVVFNDPIWSIDEVRHTAGRVVWLVSEGSRAALWTSDVADSTPMLLTSPSARPYEFAVSSDSVYWLEIGAGIRHVSLVDRASGEVYPAPQVPGVASALAVIGSEIVWVQNTRSATVGEALLWRGTVDGLTRPVAVSLGAPGNSTAHITTDDRALYVCTTACTCGRPLGGCCVDRVFEVLHTSPMEAREIYSGVSACLSFVGDGSSVYVGEYRFIVRVDPASGATDAIAPSAIPTSMYVEGDYLYWLDRRGTPDLVRADGLFLRQSIP